MKQLLDTHALLWVRADPERLKAETKYSLADPANEVFVSVVSLWKVLIKRRVGKLDADFDLMMAGMAPASKLQLLSIKPQH